jgi:hypothetical protein
MPLFSQISTRSNPNYAGHYAFLRRDIKSLPHSFARQARCKSNRCERLFFAEVAIPHIVTWHSKPWQPPKL